MWARVVEIMLGFWLMASPFIFRVSNADIESPVNELLSGLLVVVFGFSSFWDRTHWAHFLILAIAFWLIVSGFLAGHPAPPTSQNEILVGILLGMLAIIPNRANEPPKSWREFYADENAGRGN